MLGLPENRYADPAAWAGLEAELGLALPSDYKTIVDGYAPVTVNVHLSLMHPATTWWNLSKKIRDTSEAWARTSWQRDWAEDSPSDPRVICGVQELAFGTRHGLIASGDLGAELDRGEGRLDGVGGPQVDPVLGREVVELLRAGHLRAPVGRGGGGTARSAAGPADTFDYCSYRRTLVGEHSLEGAEAPTRRLKTPA
jgi:hypothetical protein